MKGGLLSGAGNPPNPHLRKGGLSPSPFAVLGPFGPRHSGLHRNSEACNCLVHFWTPASAGVTNKLIFCCARKVYQYPIIKRELTAFPPFTRGRWGNFRLKGAN